MDRRRIIRWERTWRRMKKAKPKELTPPDDIQGDALAEWDRIIAEVQATGGELKPADRSILATYCRTWAINRDAAKHIQTYGSVIKYSNGVPGASPQYKIYEKTVPQLRG